MQLSRRSISALWRWSSQLCTSITSICSKTCSMLPGFNRATVVSHQAQLGESFEPFTKPSPLHLRSSTAFRTLWSQLHIIIAVFTHHELSGPKIACVTPLSGKMYFMIFPLIKHLGSQAKSEVIFSSAFLKDTYSISSCKSTFVVTRQNMREKKCRDYMQSASRVVCHEENASQVKTKKNIEQQISCRQ